MKKFLLKLLSRNSREDRPHPGDIKYMDIKEFREAGFLQEANRLFFHPLGLALEVGIDDDTGVEFLAGIWDYRDDPEGMVYGAGVIDSAKKYNVEREAYRHHDARVKLFRLPRKKFIEPFIIQDISYGAAISKHGGSYWSKADGGDDWDHDHYVDSSWRGDRIVDEEEVVSPDESVG